MYMCICMPESINIANNEFYTWLRRKENLKKKTLETFIY